ncbi:MAG: succinate dehydrogenase, hydrophobic membrane anchor protein [Chromatiales bacterium]|nr:succinate dehydrogenase, hydrophobic membrane anchor protein [Chromatiales bacterium]
MSLKTPLGRVLGLGSAKSGFHHWWAQRLSAAALLPLTLWLLVALLMLPALDYPTVSAWLSAPLPAVLLTLLVLAMSWHSALGLQVVAEDYVHQPALRVVLLAGIKLLHVALAVTAVFSILLVSLGARP